MPNWAYNKLIAKCETDPQKAKEALDSIEGGPNDDQPGRLDFNKIVRMPQYIYRGSLGPEEEKKYGAKNCWYEWSIRNWGTKWNASDYVREDDYTIRFDTAWDGVPNLIAKLGEMFPDVEFDYQCIETGNVFYYHYNVHGSDVQLIDDEFTRSNYENMLGDISDEDWNDCFGHVAGVERAPEKEPDKIVAVSIVNKLEEDGSELM